ncbi:MAG: response regulator [Chlamydiales bacterium]|nr:response regulator [Chlamydiales bacterium]
MEINPPAFPDKKILIAEDDPLSMEILKHMLGLCAITPDAASDGEAALRFALEKRYDMIILDIHMPNKTGFEVVQEIRNKIKDHPIVVALTASVIPAELQQIKVAGFDSYVRKPIEIEDIFQLLEKYFAAKT